MPVICALRASGGYEGETFCDALSASPPTFKILGACAAPSTFCCAVEDAPCCCACGLCASLVGAAAVLEETGRSCATFVETLPGEGELPEVWIAGWALAVA